MVLLMQRRSLALLLLLCVGIVVIFGILLHDFAVDDAYITFRHARNLSSGEGFTFNPGERLLSTTSPLHALLLALTASLGLDGYIPQSAIWLSVISTVGLCAGIVLCCNRAQMPLAGAFCVLLIVGQHWIYRFFSLETVLVLALNVGTVALAVHGRWVWAGALAGIAMIGRPDSIIMGGTVGLYCLLTNKFPYRAAWRYTLPLVAIYGAWLTFSLLYFGNAFPNTLEAKSGFTSWTVYIDAIWPKMIRDLIPDYWYLSALLVLLGVIGLIDLVIHRSPLLIFPAWGLLHTIGYTVLRIPYPFAWYYAPLILITLLMAGVGGATLLRLAQKRLTYSPLLARGASLAVILLMVVTWTLSMRGTWLFISTYETVYYGGARDQVYRKVGNWLAENTPPDARVALTEVGTIGYFSNRHIIDLAGLVTYELRDLPKTGSFTETVAALQPEYVIGVRNLPPDPELVGVDGYTIVHHFPKGPENLFEDVIIYQRSPAP